MGTLPPPATRKFPDDSPEKKIYNMVEGFSQYLPLPNDRNRLAFNLYKFVTGQGDKPEVIILNAKLNLKGISPEDFAAKLSEELKKL